MAHVHVTSASPLNTSSNSIIGSHLHSPPNKIAKPSIYCRSKQSQLDTMVSDFEMLNLPGKHNKRSNKDKPVTSEQLSQRSFTLSNNKEVTHVTQSHAIVKTEKPIDTKPHNTSNMPTPPIVTSPCYMYTPNQNMFSQSQQPFFPYMFLPPPHYPYTLPPLPVPTTNPHSPGDMKPHVWPKLDFPQSDRWIYSQFNLRPLLKDTKIQETTLSFGQNRQNYPFHNKLSLPHSPHPWYTPLTSTKAVCSETISVPETKPKEPDPVTINSPKKSETSTNAVDIDVIHIEPITANKDQNSPSSDPKTQDGQSLNSLGVSPDYAKLFNLNTDPLNKYKACSKLSEKKSDTPTSRPSSV